MGYPSEFQQNYEYDFGRASKPTHLSKISFVVVLLCAFVIMASPNHIYFLFLFQSLFIATRWNIQVSFPYHLKRNNVLFYFITLSFGIINYKKLDGNRVISFIDLTKELLGILNRSFPTT